MPVRRLVSAVLDLFPGADSSVEHGPQVRSPAVPLPIERPDGWRLHTCLSGPYTRFTAAYPRDWHAYEVEGSETVHLMPGAQHGQDIALTVSSQQGSIAGPQGILETIGDLARARGQRFQAADVQLDLWRGAGWAGSWAWSEREPSGAARSWRLLVLGNDQGLLFGMVNGAPADVALHRDLCETMLATLRLPDSEILAPEHFPVALLELLNDRAAVDQSEPWRFNDEGRLSSGSLVVQLGNIYRAYLGGGGDLEQIARALDSRSRGPAASEFQGLGWDELQHRLRAVLRRAETVASMDVVQIPLGGGVVACPVLDAGDRVTYIPRVKCAQWGVDEHAMMTHAIARLDAEDSISLLEMWDNQEQALLGFQLATRDGFDSGRLLCPSLRRQFEASLGSPLLVSMPSATVIRICRDSEEIRARMAEGASEAYERRPRPLSKALWLWTEAGLVPLA